MTDGEKERVKLTAIFFNAIASGSIVTGTIGAIVAMVIKGDTIIWWHFAVMIAIFLAVGLSMHWAARRQLERLDEG